MTDYRQIFASLKRSALIPFFVLGDPDSATSLELIKTAIDAGADILELGIPFSDPIADGPTIQKADLRALAKKITPAQALDLIAQATRYKPIPVGLLVYYNLVVQYGREKFFRDFKSAGGCSVLVADLSIDDADEIAPAAKAAGLDTVFMATPNTSDDRLQRIADMTTGFLYTVSTLGVTGARDTVSDLIEPLIRRIKAITKVPVCVGFGISNARQARQVADAGADGVIIGSAIVKIIEQNLDNRPKMRSEVRQFIAEIRKALE
ncbi:MAG: tryptophan synthase subunit alpha [Phycisphaerae bacterium]|nr:tryptophan synthase subunit alpha [Phycisphaerae bacterium]